MQKNSEQFANCARDSITVQTGSTLKLRLKFTVTPEGRAMNPQILNLREPDPDLRLCLIRVIKRIEFPKPADKQPKEINYPITLKAD